ncbi:MAG: MFS transporter [Planctomycetia bacterium]|nr:MFS transporter [Planctomycetia bacterium]
MEPSRPANNPSGGDWRISKAAWLALLAAFLGWMFDGFEMGLFPMVARPALTELVAGPKVLSALQAPPKLPETSLPLREFAERIRARHGIDVVVETKTLEEAKISVDTAVTVPANAEKLKAALDGALAKQGLAYFAADDVLHITTKKGGGGPVLLWLGVMTAIFLVGAATGGVVFGWLGDRIGRVWAMTLSVLTYAVFMGLCGLSRDVYMMFALRFMASLGMGGEWSLGVALVMESWPNRSRAFMAGLIGAASNVGFLTIGLVGLSIAQDKAAGTMESWLLSVGLSESWVRFFVVDGMGNKSGWRLLMILGAVPALLTFFIRIAVPESERWLHSKKRGAASHWATIDMLGVLIGAAGAIFIIFLWAFRFTGLAEDYGPRAVLAVRIVGSVVGFAIALGGFIYPVVRYVQRARQSAGTANAYAGTLPRMILGACLSGIALIGTWASLQNAPTWADQLVEKEMKAQGATDKAVTSARNEARALTGIFTAIGAIIGTMAAAFLGNAIGRRPAYILLCIGSLIAALAFFRLNTAYGPMFLWMSLAAGGITASFYGWLPLYLPELFRTQVRATGQGFSFNFGRILAAIGALQFGTLVTTFFDDKTEQACSVMSLVYLVGLVIIWFVPETKGQPLPE